MGVLIWSLDQNLASVRILLPLGVGEATLQSSAEAEIRLNLTRADAAHVVP